MPNPPIIKIASRTSALAMWQTNMVKAQLNLLGADSAVVPVESTGDVELTKPIYELGVTGVFTRQLDIALLQGTADIAVHSLKDVPTQLADGLHLAAVLQRGSPYDVLVMKDYTLLNQPGGEAVIATSSLRRQAQWLAKYPGHTVTPIRGNVPTRLQKFNADAQMDGIIFAQAGLQRLGILPAGAVTLNWMLPAPAQGIIGVVCRANDAAVIKLCETFNHAPTYAAAIIERQFMRTLMGGCSVPVSALAIVEDNTVKLTGAMHSFDGAREYRIEKTYPLLTDAAGQQAAEALLQIPGAPELLQEIRNRKQE